MSLFFFGKIAFCDEAVQNDGDNRKSDGECDGQNDEGFIGKYEAGFGAKVLPDFPMEDVFQTSNEATTEEEARKGKNHRDGVKAFGDLGSRKAEVIKDETFPAVFHDGQ